MCKLSRTYPGRNGAAAPGAGVPRLLGPHARELLRAAAGGGGGDGLLLLLPAEVAVGVVPLAVVGHLSHHHLPPPLLLLAMRTFAPFSLLKTRSVSV